MRQCILLRRENESVVWSRYSVGAVEGMQWRNTCFNTRAATKFDLHRKKLAYPSQLRIALRFASLVGYAKALRKYIPGVALQGLETVCDVKRVEGYFESGVSSRLVSSNFRVSRMRLPTAESKSQRIVPSVFGHSGTSRTPERQGIHRLFVRPR